MKLILRIFINAVAIWVTSLLLPGLDFEGNLGSLIIVGLIFGLVNALIRPIVKLLTLPINILTLGLFTLVINALMLLLTVAISSSLNFTGGFLEFSVENLLLNAFVGAILISVVSTVLSWVLPD
ncbi:MAG: phage holin family protein [Anaerolineae bacterium]|nr:MAG: phage holin family protein [Anaerolineae bacterium]